MFVQSLFVPDAYYRKCWHLSYCQMSMLRALAIYHFISVKLYLLFERYYLSVSGKFGCRIENNNKKQQQILVKHIYRICDTCPIQCPTATCITTQTDMISPVQCQDDYYFFEMALKGIFNAFHFLGIFIILQMTIKVAL